MDVDDTPAAPARDAAPSLTYDGTDIRQRGLMLNLTDMWRAAGGPAYRRPAIWLDMEETKRFRAYARWRWSGTGSLEPDLIVTHGDIKRAEPDGLVLTTRGQRGETWAHWQLALSYARHLSPAFHAWGNTVIRNAMERFGGPPRRRDGVMRYVEHQFDQLHSKLDHMNRHAADQMFLLGSPDCPLSRNRHCLEVGACRYPAHDGSPHWFNRPLDAGAAEASTYSSGRLARP